MPLGHLLQTLGRGSRDGLHKVIPLGILLLTEVRRVEQLLKARDLRPLLCCHFYECEVFDDVLFLVHASRSLDKSAAHDHLGPPSPPESVSKIVGARADYVKHLRM